MSWAQGRGRGWSKLRASVLRRDRGICYVCHQAGADTVDHVVPLARGGTSHPSNLAAIHSRPCHATKTAQEAAEGRRLRRASGLRPPERHPGSLSP